ncbi:SAM-dependent methyltransferase [Streptomyces sp. NPDC046385]|uniref:SAM-dependent methyltransferase n=1 Tax=Streptomyces sp. NPDC046385 TaxID=3154918 RepID=UPI0033C4FA08
MMGSGTFSTRDELKDLFNGLEMVAPGLVRCTDWRRDDPRTEQNAAQQCIAGGVARKP